MSLTHVEWAALVRAFERLAPSAMWMWDDEQEEVQRVDLPEAFDVDGNPVDVDAWEGGDDYAALWVADAMRAVGFVFEATDTDIVTTNRAAYRERNDIPDDDPREPERIARCVADYRAKHPRKGA